MTYVIYALEPPIGLRSQIRGQQVDVLHSRNLFRRREIANNFFNPKDSKADISLEFLDKKFDLQLRHDSALFEHGIHAVIVGSDGVHQPFIVDRENYWIGIVIGDPNSQVNVYISPAGVLEGHMNAFGEDYVFEFAHRHFSESVESVSDYTVVYRLKDVIDPSELEANVNHTNYSFCGNSEHDHAHGEQTPEEHKVKVKLPFRPTLSRRSPASATFNTCTMSIVADYSFFVATGSNQATALAQMLTHITRANDIVKGTTFTGFNSLPEYSSIKLASTNVVIYSTNVNALSTAGATATQSSFLDAFANLNTWTTCLAHLFTANNFGSTLGLAYVGQPGSSGGICDNLGSKDYNTGWTSIIGNGVLLVAATAQLVTAHEIGHNFGASHDGAVASSTTLVFNDTLKAQCLTEAGETFLMNPIAVSGSQTRNSQFSTCSRRLIRDTIASKGNCFVVPANGFCGDGVRCTNASICSSGIAEVCDAGSTGDTCCYGLEATSLQCKYKDTAYKCTPSNDVCCTSSCLISNSTTPCYTATQNDNSCRSTSLCNGINATTCPASIAQPLGTPCGNGDSCNGLTATTTSCIDFCTKYQATKCTCENSNDCRLCCKHDSTKTVSCGSPFKNYNTSGTSGTVFTCTRADVALLNVANVTCKTSTYWTAKLGKAIYFNASQRDPYCATYNSSNSNETCLGILDLQQNTPCSIGVCGSTAKCEALSTKIADSESDKYSSLSISNAAYWMQKNIVGTVLIFSFLLWVPFGCWMSKSDKRAKKENAYYGMRPHDTNKVGTVFKARRAAVGKSPQAQAQVYRKK